MRKVPLSVRGELRERGIARAEDALLRFPLRYEDWMSPQPVASLQHDQTALVEGTIVDARFLRMRGGRRQALAQVEDENGDLLTMRFFNVTHGMEHALEVGRKLRARGAVKLGRGREMLHPKMQSANAPGKMQAVYSALGGLTQYQQRQVAVRALATLQWEETVPERWRKFNGGDIGARQAMEWIHQPPPANAEVLESLKNGAHNAWRRLRFDELLAHQIILRARHRRRSKKKAPPILPPQGWQKPLLESLPFSLTAAQKKAADEIVADIARPRPMQRLLQGDVGSGKTAVAALAMLAAIKSGHTAALMAPTDILARQHYQTLRDYFRSSKVECEIFLGAIRGARRAASVNRMRLGLSRAAIGTHALFYEEKNLPKPGLVVIDEQHRFGVGQRRALNADGESHQLMMSATPIPRTLALGMFSHMDITTLDEIPPGRRPVSTVLAPCERRDEILRRIGKKNSAAYWVCPLIDDSADSNLQDAHSMLELARRECPQLSPTLLHGRMSSAEKQAAVDKFRGGECRLLVATTVIEVGMDVPQADVMVIDRAERMGLSQLHQLRGRVGRGGRDGVCLLLYGGELSDEARGRLKILRQTSDGFKIAEEDLRMRGPGEWLGTRQSGLPAFRVARPGEDVDLIKLASGAAEWLLDNDRRAAATHARRWLRRPPREADAD